MAVQYKTRCPHCSAQFRIGEDHLKQANGAVRCGSCLKVFQASENLVKDSPAAKPKSPAQKPTAPAASSATGSAATSPAQSAEEWSLPKKQGSDSTENKWSMDDSSAQLNDDDDLSMLDEDFDDKSVTKDEYKGNNTSMSLGGLELSDSFMNMDEDGDSSLRQEDFSDMSGAGKTSHGDDDESWAEALLEELDSPAQKQESSPAPAKTPEPEEEDWANEADDFFSDVESPSAQSADSENAVDKEDDWASEADDFFGDSDQDDDDVGMIDLPEIEDIPKSKPSRASLKENLAKVRPAVDMGAQLKWTALSAVFLIVFSLQYLAFNFSELARTPSWRGLYGAICQPIGCALPNPSNVKKLRGSNLVISSHPSVSGALIVDVIVYNEARYEQPFPQLELSFSSLRGVPVATRRFRPEEYKHGELTSLSTMPVNTPIHISFEIIDPGPDAVNYSLKFAPAPI